MVEGAAGAGKTTTLAATKDAIRRTGPADARRAPHVEGRPVAAREVGTGRAGGVAGAPARLLVGPDGRWTQVAADPAPELRCCGRGELLLIDEAGMLDQDTAGALLTVADETGPGSRWWVTGISSPRSAAAASSTSPPAGPHPRR